MTIKINKEANSFWCWQACANKRSSGVSVFVCEGNQLTLGHSDFFDIIYQRLKLEDRLLLLLAISLSLNVIVMQP